MESVKLSPGEMLPGFTLPDVEGKLHHSSESAGNSGLLLVVTCNHCPYAKAIWPRLILLADNIAGQGITTIAINPNIHPQYPEDSPEQMKKLIKKEKIRFPYLIDADQEVAKKLKAQCTPDIYLYDGNLKLYYHGRFDDNWQQIEKVKEKSLELAISDMAEGRPANADFYPSMGCSIKWRGAP